MSFANVVAAQVDDIRRKIIVVQLETGKDKQPVRIEKWMCGRMLRLVKVTLLKGQST